VKARDVFAAPAGRFGKRRNLMPIGALLALSALAALGSGAPSAGADAACPNEAIRLQQGSTQTGDCRAWERVSPAEKGDGDIIAEGLAIVAEKEGNGATFDSLNGFGDTVGSGFVGRTTYLARRGPAGWSTHSITPTPRPEQNQVLFAKNKIQVFSQDLATALMWAYDLPSVTDDTPQRMNLYVEDTATRAARPVSVSQVEPLNPFDFIDPESAPLGGVSDDAKHLAFATVTQMLPNAAPNPAQNVYRWDDGVLSLAGVLPDGTTPPAGSTLAYNNARDTMSADGSRLAFYSTGDGSQPSQLYLRSGNVRTDLISESENPFFTEPAQTVYFEGMTADGNNVYFTTESPLLAADTAPGPDLYRWTSGPDPEDEPNNLTLISTNGGAVTDWGVYGGALVGMSGNGQVVYVHDIGGFLYVWNDGVRTTVDPSFTRGNSGDLATNLLASHPGATRVSPDGNWLAYLKDDSQMYLYDRATDTRTCVSCPGGASVVPTVTHASGAEDITFRPRFLTDNGRVFFTSTGALVPEDVNGVADVYEYDGPTGKLSLLSSGTGNEPSEFADAGAAGNDVFFVTRQRLALSDHDEYADLYDARVGGGFDEAQPPASPCLGESCQGAGAADAGTAAISSTGATRGNLKPRRGHRCGKGRRAIKRHGRTHCVPKKHRGHPRRGSK
jgi:hypothetical protein